MQRLYFYFILFSFFSHRSLANSGPQVRSSSLKNICFYFFFHSIFLTDIVVVLVFLPVDIIILLLFTRHFVTKSIMGPLRVTVIMSEP